MFIVIPLRFLLVSLWPWVTVTTFNAFVLVSETTCTQLPEEVVRLFVFLVCHLNLSC